MVLADILDSVIDELPKMTALALLQQVLMLTLFMGGFLRALLTLVPALVSLPVTAGLLPLVHADLNYLNVILLPTLLGMGEDGGAHLVSRVTAGEDLGHALAHTGRATLGATLTTAFGFGAMITASHPGLRSFGWVAILGLAVNLVACLVFLPAVLALFQKRRDGSSGWAALVSTVGRAGHAPHGPGTLGALLALPLAWALRSASWTTKLAVAAGATALAVLAADLYARRRDKKDPQEVVSDELVGCLIALLMVPWSPAAAVAAFLLFRLFDIWKPGPVRFAERRLPGGYGIVGDDVLAGVLAGAVVLFGMQIVALARVW
jgi:phosphatidylglycerophosphatase A